MNKIKQYFYTSSTILIDSIFLFVAVVGVSSILYSFRDFL